MPEPFPHPTVSHSIQATNTTQSKALKQLIQAQADTHGLDFSYLLKTAEQESSLNPKAKSQSSTATGLFQFIESTWLAMVKRHGAKHGLASEAAAITQNENGHYSVPNANMRTHILNLRKEPALSTAMAAAYALENKEKLQPILGRAPNNGELYMAHFLGATGASKLLQLNMVMPDAPAHLYFPSQAEANKPIFYDASQNARSINDVIRKLQEGFTDEKPLPTAMTRIVATRLPLPAPKPLLTQIPTLQAPHFQNKPNPAHSLFVSLYTKPQGATQEHTPVRAPSIFTQNINDSAK